MIVNAGRILNLVRGRGFSLLSQDRGTHDIHYVRDGDSTPIFEMIHVSGQGKRGEAVYAKSEISIIRNGYGIRCSLGERQFLDGLGKDLHSYDPERQWNIIGSKDDAVAWERALAEAAPAHVSNLAEVKGSEILRRTESIRRAASEYVRLLDSKHSLFEIEEYLSGIASSGARQEAERMLRTPGLIWVVGDEGERLYRIGILLILVHGQAVENIPRAYWGEIPLDDLELMGRIQLNVDLLARPERGLVKWPTDLVVRRRGQG